jgi:excisionase family DNA binding protein
MSVPESTRITGLGLSLSYKWVREGKLPAVQIDGRWYVHRPKLLEWLATPGGGASAA